MLYLALGDLLPGLMYTTAAESLAQRTLLFLSLLSLSLSLSLSLPPSLPPFSAAAERRLTVSGKCLARYIALLAVIRCTT